MPQCAFKNCVNNHRNVNISQGMSFFRFPSDSFRCAEWASIVAKERNEIYNPCKYSRICSIHFDRLDITGNTQRRRLLKTAVPKLQIHGPIEVQSDISSDLTKGLSNQNDDPMPAVDKREVKVFCPKCKTKVLHNVEGIQKDETSKILIANVYHYFEQEYEELTKTYEGVDLTPLSKFGERTALATGVSVSTVLEIVQERANADVPLKPARKRPRQSESSSEEDSCGGDEDDGEHSTTEHVVTTLVVKEEPETFNDEPEVYVQLAGVKTVPDACGDDRELADPISVNIRTEPQNEKDTTSSEAVAVLSAAKRRKGSIKQRHAEAPAASCGAPSGHSDCETLAALSAAKPHKGSIKQRHAEAPAASCVAPSGQMPLPPDQQLTLHNPLTNQQRFS